MRAAEPAWRCDAETRLLADCLLTPERALALDLAQWGGLLRKLRRNALLATYAERAAGAGVLDRVPAKAREQMAFARIAAQSARTAVRYEAHRMLRALRAYDGPLVLLKGAAYDAARLPCADGRVSGDLDVMVPASRLGEVERALLDGGWRTTRPDPYDQRYYREWSHELPALLHPQRETPIDLHHTIAAPVSRAHPDAPALFAASLPSASPRLRVLGQADMVLHSTLHLFNDEVARPLRDLFDIHVLLARFGGRERFWDELAERAALHGIERPLHYMLTSVRSVFGTEIPADARARAATRSAAIPVDWTMRRLFAARYSARFLGSRRIGDRAAREALYVRAHWLRMPPLLLAAHLARKSVRRMRGVAEAPPLAQADRAATGR